MIVKQNVHQKRATRLTVEQCDQMAKLFFNIVNCNCESVKIEPVNFCICIHFISQNNIFINLLNYNKRPLEAAFVQFEMLLLYLKLRTQSRPLWLLRGQTRWRTSAECRCSGHGRGHRLRSETKKLSSDLPKFCLLGFFWELLRHLLRQILFCTMHCSMHTVVITLFQCIWDRWVECRQYLHTDTHVRFGCSAIMILCTKPGADVINFSIT